MKYGVYANIPPFSQIVHQYFHSLERLWSLWNLEASPRSHREQTLKSCSFAPCLMCIFPIVSMAKGVLSQVSTLAARRPASPAILKYLSGTVHPNKLLLRWIKLIKQGKSKLQTEEELHCHITTFLQYRLCVLSVGESMGRVLWLP